MKHSHLENCKAGMRKVGKFAGSIFSELSKYCRSLKSRAYSDPSPFFWGMSYIIAIPVFALCFWLMPDKWFQLGNSHDKLENYIDALYFSAITITSLGYGDIYPIATGAKIGVMLESVFGITVIGVFMFAVGVRKSKIDSEEEKQRTELIRIDAEKLKLKRQKIVIHPYLDNYLTYAICVSSPMKSRSALQYNPEFTLHDLQDLFQMSLLLRDDPGKSAVEHYYYWLKELETRLEILLASVDLSLWPELEQEILRILKFFRDFDASSALLAMPGRYYKHTENGKEIHINATDNYSNLIKNWKGETKFYDHNSINQAVALYFQIKGSVPIAQNLENMIDKIVNE